MNNKVYCLIYGIGIGANIVYLLRARLIQGNDFSAIVFLIIITLFTFVELVIDDKE